MSQIFLPLGKYMKILTEIEHSPKHIFTRSKQGVEQCPWYFPMCTIKKEHIY